MLKKTKPNILNLRQAEMFILNKPVWVSTVLGSCVTVTLYNKRLGLAAICHALLPHCQKNGYKNSVDDLLDEGCLNCGDAFRYVDCAVVMMVESFARFGIPASETRVSVVGGASMLAQSDAAGHYPVGLQNVHVAQRVLADHRLDIAFSETGGSKGRKLFFNTQTGKVIVQPVGENPCLPFTQAGGERRKMWRPFN